jgi:hypothetical protein
VFDELADLDNYIVASLDNKEEHTPGRHSGQAARACLAMQACSDVRM